MTRQSLLLAIAATLVACTSSATTKLEVTISGAAVTVDHYEVLVGANATLTTPLAELDVVLPDDTAGEPTELRVWGLTSGTQVAYGMTTATPDLHRTVGIDVTVAPLTCDSTCTAGATACAGSGTITCELADSGCLGWSTATPCPAATPACSNGACVVAPTCSNEGGACDDGDACTSGDTCSHGMCLGTEIACTTPPAPDCASDTALRTYAASGTCAAGACAYTSTMTTCAVASPCSAGACGGPPPNLVFVTSAVFDGALGGLAGADAKCQSIAEGQHLAGTYKAWLSDSTVSAASRMTHSPNLYLLTNGEEVAANWTELTSGTLRHRINYDETGAVLQSREVMTETYADGTSAGTDNCNHWTDATSSYQTAGGFSSDLDQFWSYNTESLGTCVAMGSLYCIQQ